MAPIFSVLFQELFRRASGLTTHSPLLWNQAKAASVMEQRAKDGHLLAEANPCSIDSGVMTECTESGSPLR